MAQISTDRASKVLPPYARAPIGDGHRIDAATNVAAGEAPTSKPRAGILARTARSIPTLMVMALLAGIGWYGHHSGWKLPKFSALAGNNSDKRQNWCEEHGVAESQCVECRPDLMPREKDFGWCGEHGVSNCPLCHPEIAQLKRPPAVTDTDRQRAARALAASPRGENSSECKNYRHRIQLASAEAAAKAGLDVAVADRRPVVESIAANGKISYDQTRFANLSSRLPGTVWRVEKRVGDGVCAGEVLALVDAAEVGRAKSELIQALTNQQLKRDLLRKMEVVADIMPQIQLQEARAEAMQADTRSISAQQALGNLGLSVNIEHLRELPQEMRAEHLRLLGLPESITKNLGPNETTANLLPVKAPLDGIVVARSVVAGEAVDASRVMFQVADTSRMWLTLNVSAEDVGKLALGQSVRFRPDGSPEEVADVTGKIVWISTTADRQTRMVTVRAELPNPRGTLRSETFGAGKIVVREERDAVVVPSEAVHWEGCCNVVFVRDKGYEDKPENFKVFHVRMVRPGARNENQTEIIAGVLPGEVVASKGSDVLRGALLKSKLGEGCGDD
jgi:multidrug efflux pump subunit AcrA (membrane-fusion protein)